MERLSYWFLKWTTSVSALRLGKEGEVVGGMGDRELRFISEIEEREGRLWMGSMSKKEYTHIRGKPFLIWEQMDLICSSSMANGHLASSFVAQEDSHPPSQSYQQDVSDDYEIDLDLNTSGMGLEDDALNSITQQPPVQTNDEATLHRVHLLVAVNVNTTHKSVLKPLIGN
ncbi:hypothetical protein Taro_046643 [Colocasia esculenta]|uniref:Uncharacterized protein n=1 Tax=Colocasia esculenta TaxID=4460 RepID=A0A843WUA3_COLES|nr:hypothetical protein [Colocasia esculenta]